MRFASPAVFLAFVACSGSDGKTSPDGSDTPDVADADTDVDTDADTDTDTDTDTPPGCVASVASVAPVDGDTLVRVDTVVTLSFDGQADAASVSVEVSGHPGAVEVAPDGMSATWTPDEPLEPESDYTVDAQVCGNAFSSDFTTLPLEVDLADVIGNTYGVSWADVVISEPGAGNSLKDLIQIDYVLLQINAVDGAGVADSIATIAGSDGTGGIVAECEMAVREDADFSLNPYYRFSGTLNLVINPTSGQTADIEDFEMIGRVSDDGGSLLDVELSGLADSEDFLPGFDCNSLVIQAFQPNCLPCTTAASKVCMEIQMTAVEAPKLDGFDLSAVCPI